MSKSVSLYNGAVNLNFDSAKHAYTWDGKFIPGVTSILRILDKPALVQWAANMASDYIAARWEHFARTGTYEQGEVEFFKVCKEAKTAHRRASKDAADIGTQVHKFAEQALTEKRVPLPTDPSARKGATAFLDWLHLYKPEPIACERIIFSRKFYYAGTCDFFGHVDGKLCVLDFKTSSGLYLEMILQLAAYALALEEETGERIDQGWVIRLDKKTGKCQPYPIPIKNSYKDAFIRVREAHELLGKIGDDLDGIRKIAA